MDKAALLAGFGRDNIRVVAARRALRDAPRRARRRDRRGPRAGTRPCAVVATTGTTTTTALDPVDAIAEVAASHGLWLHVDAAMAGSAMILPECRWMWDGVEGADSLVINPHKWLGAAFDCSLYFVRDAEHLVRVMSTNPSYLQISRRRAGEELPRLGHSARPPLSRAEALVPDSRAGRERPAGAAAPRHRQRAVARRARCASTPGWRVLAPVPLQTLCVRHEPDGLTGEALDRHTLAWVERINRSGAAYLTPAMLDGRWMVRVSIGSEQTERAHVEALWALMQREVTA